MCACIGGSAEGSLGSGCANACSLVDLPPSLPPSAPSSPEDLAADSPACDLDITADAAQLLTSSADSPPNIIEESEQQPQDSMLRVGVRLRSVRALSFGLDAGFRKVAAPRPRATTPPEPEPRRVKRTKLELALAEVAELKSEMQQQRARGSARAAARVEACPHCPDLQEQLRRRTAERAYWQRQHGIIEEKVTEGKELHAAELEAMEKKHEKKQEKALLAAGRTLDYARDDIARLKGEKSKLADDLRTMTRTMKDYMRELGQEKNLNKKLMDTELALQAEVAELRGRVDKLEKYKAEIEREMQSSDEDEELTGNTLGEDADDDGDDVDRDERTEGRMPEIAGALHNASCAALALRRLERRLAVACLCCSP